MATSFTKKKYVTTALAGFWVASRKIPADMKGGKLVPKIGFELELTDLEAKYELAAGTIEPVIEAPSKKPSKAD